MEIPAQIKELVDLALKDAIITPLERQTIVNEAIDCGIRESEINKYINQKLDEKLSKRSKDQLKACPKCGAQIPLLADNCPYCGHEYSKADISDKKQTADSHAAAIIESENQRIEDEKQNLEHCPNCGHPYPLISNICPACKHVLHHNEENELNIQRLIDKIKDGANRIKKVEGPSIGNILLFRGCATSLFVIAVMILYFTKFPSGYLLTLAAIAAPFGLICLFFDNSQNNPVDRFNRAYNKFLSEIKVAYNHINNFYGDHQEAYSLLDDTSKMLHQLNEQREQEIRKKHFIILLIAVIIIVPYFFI
ncbi:MAG: zinc ribbon domain-containing protein [Bacteroidales bacterium]|nr:zinc ribbon domain-containing protein [Bacteroidales bacterium]